MIRASFFKTCIGISMVILSLGFLFRSIQPAKASHFETNGSSNHIGKYTISLSGAPLAPGSLDYILFATIMNTETGQSETYYRSKKGFVKLSDQLPTAEF